MIKDIENIIYKYLYQMKYLNVINELKKDIEIYKKYIKNRKYVKKFSYSQIKSLIGMSSEINNSTLLHEQKKIYILVKKCHKKPTLYLKPNFILLNNDLTKINESFENIFMNNGFNNLYYH